MKIKLNIKKLTLASLSLLLIGGCAKQINAVTFSSGYAEQFILANCDIRQNRSDFFKSRFIAFCNVPNLTLVYYNELHNMRMRGLPASVNFSSLKRLVFRVLSCGEIPLGRYESTLVSYAQTSKELVENLKAIMQAYSRLAGLYEVDIRLVVANKIYLDLKEEIEKYEKLRAEDRMRLILDMENLIISTRRA